MKKKRIAVLNPAEIAIRRFMPALIKTDCFEFIGIGTYTAEERFLDDMPEESIVCARLEACKKKATDICNMYGGRVFDSYMDVVESDDVDAVYIPLPPALHNKWAKLALENGKHVLVEKPSTTSLEDTKELVKLAQKHDLVLFENYMFLYHNQMEAIKNILKEDTIGDVRLHRCAFEFPLRSANDFRYDKKMGGGALLDAGGYTIRLATELLGPDTRVVCANLSGKDGYLVDMFGSGTLTNEKGQVVQVSFGMDNAYQCSLEIFGEKGILRTGRIFTAPDGFTPELCIETGKERYNIELPPDNSFCKSLQTFAELIDNEEKRSKNNASIILQSKLVDEFKMVASSMMKE